MLPVVLFSSKIAFAFGKAQRFERQACERQACDKQGLERQGFQRIVRTEARRHGVHASARMRRGDSKAFAPVARRQLPR